VNGLHIAGSPFSVVTLSASVTGSSSVATGSGVTTAVAGVEAHFEVEARDQRGNERHTGEVDGVGFTAVLNMVTVSTRPANLDTMVDDGWGSGAVVNGVSGWSGEGGIYTVVYNATISGVYSLSVQSTADGNHIVGSPFTVTVRPNVASGTESDVTGTGTRLGVAGVAEPVEVYLRDVFGNYVLSGGDRVHVRTKLLSRHMSGWELMANEAERVSNGVVLNGVGSGDYPLSEIDSEEDVAVIDYSNGRYYAHYTPRASGRYELAAYLDAPGGLWGSYFTDDKFVATHLSTTKHDVEINNDWGVYSPFSSGLPHSVSCLTVGTTGVSLDDADTTLFDERRCTGNGLGERAKRARL